MYDSMNIKYKGGVVMALTLYCKDVPVYDIDNDTVITPVLLPGIMRMDACQASYNSWRHARYSCNTNAYARQLKGVTFGQRNRHRIDSVTRSFSLSDCYWVKDSDDMVSFSDMTPYINNFWFDSRTEYKGNAVPTLYTNGFLSKKWLDRNVLLKQSNENEYECLRVLTTINKYAGTDIINVEPLYSYEDGMLTVGNFTSLDWFFESAEMSGKLDAENFTLQDEIAITGVDTPIVDAIVGNGDRHAGNFGYLRDPQTGDYLCGAPMFDFDHALDVKTVGMDILMQDGVESARLDVARVKLLCDGFINYSVNPIYKQRAKYLITHCC